jgi:large subunit ribosomal protein L7/L12
MNDLNVIVDQLSGLSVPEALDLVKRLETKWGVTADHVSVNVAPPVFQTTGEAIEAKISFNVLLKDAGASKVNVMKALRPFVTIGLKELKELVDSAPVVIKTDLGKEEATDIQGKLETAGATVALE